MLIPYKSQKTPMEGKMLIFHHCCEVYFSFFLKIIILQYYWALRSLPSMQSPVILFETTFVSRSCFSFHHPFSISIPVPVVRIEAKVDMRLSILVAIGATKANTGMLVATTWQKEAMEVKSKSKVPRRKSSLSDTGTKPFLIKQKATLQQLFSLTLIAVGAASQYY